MKFGKKKGEEMENVFEKIMTEKFHSLKKKTATGRESNPNKCSLDIP